MHIGSKIYSTIKWITAVLLSLLGISAIFGGAALTIDPSGELIQMPIEQFSKNSPFDSFLIPGIILFLVIGVGSLLSLILLWRGHEYAEYLVIGEGVASSIWIIVQVLMLGFSHPMQLIVELVGWSLLLLGLFLWLATKIIKHDLPKKVAV